MKFGTITNLAVTVGLAGSAVLGLDTKVRTKILDGVDNVKANVEAGAEQIGIHLGTEGDVGADVDLTIDCPEGLIAIGGVTGETCVTGSGGSGSDGGGNGGNGSGAHHSGDGSGSGGSGSGSGGSGSGGQADTGDDGLINVGVGTDGGRGSLLDVNANTDGDGSLLEVDAGEDGSLLDINGVNSDGSLLDVDSDAVDGDGGGLLGGNGLNIGGGGNGGGGGLNINIGG